MSPGVSDKRKKSIEKRFTETSNTWGVHLEIMQVELKRLKSYSVLQST